MLAFDGQTDFSGTLAGELGGRLHLVEAKGNPAPEETLLEVEILDLIEWDGQSLDLGLDYAEEAVPGLELQDHLIVLFAEDSLSLGESTKDFSD